MAYQQTGVSQTILVLKQGREVVALPTQVVATVRAADSFALSISKQVTPAVAKHYQEVIAPLAEELCQSLGLGSVCINVQFLPLEALELLGIESLVQGHSADLSVLVAIVSALTGIEVGKDVLMTGSIVSAAGHIGAVQNLTEKVDAFDRDTRFSTLLCPKLDRDGSVKTLVPKHLTHERVARISDKSIHSVETIREIWERVFEQRPAISWRYSTEKTSIPAWLNPLVEVSESRYWPHFAKLLANNEIVAAQDLLSLRGSADAGFLAAFSNALLNAPLPIKRLVSLDELLPVEWKNSVAEEQIGELTSAFADEEADDSLTAVQCFDLLLARLSEAHLSTTIDNPIDDAAASFVSNWERSGSVGAYWNEIQRFLAHVSFYRTGAHSPASAFAQDAVSMVDTLGGAKAAIRLAQNMGISGMRQILEQICDELKRNARESYCRFLFVRLTEGTDAELRVELAELLISHFKAILPSEVLSESPARYANEFDDLLLALIGQQTIFHRQVTTK